MKYFLLTFFNKYPEHRLFYSIFAGSFLCAQFGYGRVSCFASIFCIIKRRCAVIVVFDVIMGFTVLYFPYLAFICGQG